MFLGFKPSQGPNASKVLEKLVAEDLVGILSEG
jgi:hypothetical protein